MKLLLLFSRVKKEETVSFLRRLSVMVRAGIPVADCIEKLRVSVSASMKPVAEGIFEDLVGGLSLSDAFAKHPHVFPPFFLQMVKIGEAGGTLDTVLSAMADYYEKEIKLRRKVKTALVYPTVLFVMVIAVTLFLALFVLPRFRDTVSAFGGEIPKLTAAVLSVSDFLLSNAVLLFALAAVLILGITLFLRTEKGRRCKATLLDILPITGSVRRALLTSRFSRGMILLLSGGVPLIACLEELAPLPESPYKRRRFDRIIEDVTHGAALSVALEQSRLFPAMLLRMVEAGEVSGNLEEVLSSTSSYFDDFAEARLSRAVTMLEPLMILLLGGVITVVILSVLLPMISVLNSI